MFAQGHRFLKRRNGPGVAKGGKSGEWGPRRRTLVSWTIQKKKKKKNKKKKQKRCNFFTVLILTPKLKKTHPSGKKNIDKTKRPSGSERKKIEAIRRYQLSTARVFFHDTRSGKQGVTTSLTVKNINYRRSKGKKKKKKNKKKKENQQKGDRLACGPMLKVP